MIYDGICNWSMRLRRRQPQIWGFVAIVPLLLTTVIVCPICFLWDVVYEIPRMFRNFWDDLYHTIKGHVNWYRITMSCVYADVWLAIRGRIPDNLNKGEMK